MNKRISFPVESSVGAAVSPELQGGGVHETKAKVSLKSRSNHFKPRRYFETRLSSVGMKDKRVREDEREKVSSVKKGRHHI